jgi:hypothetical protein
VAAVAASLAFATPSRDEAMPIFAQALHVDCSTCHTAVPMLNDYGRMVQRSGYSALDVKTLKRAFPVWLDEQTSYDSQSATAPHQTQFGNLAFHAAGPLNTTWTYHIQQFLVSGNQPGGLDTAWFADNALLGRNGHLFVGKIELPAPSPFSQWSDVSPFAGPEMTVGEHVWQNDANRWGTKLTYLRDRFVVDAAYVGSDGDLGGATDFAPVNGKAFQWRAAFANAERPLEIGLYGNVGTVPLSEGGIDRFSSLSAYAERDPKNGLPGIFALYQHGHDGNPGNGAPAASSRAYALELFTPIFRGNALVSIRRETTNDGLGTVVQSGDVDLTVRIARFLRFYGEAGLQQNARPAWRWFLRWTTPIQPLRAR